MAQLTEADNPSFLATNLHAAAAAECETPHSFSRHWGNPVLGV
jgi:hypothetical protein